MRGTIIKGEETGERTRLLVASKTRDDRRSTFKLGDDDMKVLARNDKTPITTHKTEAPRSSHGHERNTTGLSEGNVTALSSGGSFDDSTTKKKNNIINNIEIRKKRKRRRLHLSMTKVLVGLCYVLVLCYTCIILIGPLRLSFQEESDWCPVYDNSSGGYEESSSSSPAFHWDVPIQNREYENPDFIQDPCRYARVPELLWITLEECDYSRRMLTSVILGGIIGYERRTSDRPAGIRTMGLVSLGACFFTISSITAFRSSTMPWDASRVTAALPSGVGFLGAALIWKGSVGNGDNEVHQVHGLTTAASLWLSAAIGVGAGGALYFVSVYSTVLILLVLRFGPTFYLRDGSESDEEASDTEEEEVEEEEEVSERNAAKERWLDQERSSAKSIRRAASSSFRSAGSEHKNRAERGVSFHIQPGFPESLTSEDYDVRSSSTLHTLDMGSSVRSTTGDSSVRERKRRRHPHSPAVYEPPTFHS